MSAALAGPPPPSPHQGASTGRRFGAWRPTGSGPNSIVQASGPELLRRSRDLVRNNGYARKAVGLIATHVVGIGIKPRFLVKNAGVRKALTDLFESWVPIADSAGTLDFFGLQALAAREMGEAGEAFGRLRTRRLSDGLPVPLQLQLLPSEQVPLEWSQPNGANAVTQGIERDALGRRVAYWCRAQHPNDWTGWMPQLDVVPTPVPAADIVHLFNQVRIGQLRGLPWLAAAMPTLKQAVDYVDAELLRKQLAASIVAFVKRAIGEDMSPDQMAAAWGIVQDQVMGDLPGVSMEPGTVQYLNPGESIDFNTPADVGGSFEPFLAANLRHVAAAVEQLYEELTGDWSKTNDRTFRAQFNTFRRLVQQWQYGLLVAQFCAPVMMRFVDLAVASGALRVPKSVSDADLRRVAWLPHRHEYIQPVQDLQATGLELAYGLTSRTSAVAERGDNVEDIDDQVAADRAREAARGLAYSAGVIKPAPPSGTDQNPGAAPGQEHP